MSDATDAQNTFPISKNFCQKLFFVQKFSTGMIKEAKAELLVCQGRHLTLSPLLGKELYFREEARNELDTLNLLN